MAALLLLITACSDDETSSTTASDTTGASDASDTASSESAASADPSKSVVKVGFSSVDQGAVGLPGSTAGAQAAEKYINAELGGINGHPLQVDVCHVDLDPQSNQTCGQQFANDASMHVVNAGWMFNGASFYSALATSGKPIMGSIPLNDADYASQATFWSPGQLIQRANAKLATLLAPDAKKIAILRQDNATGQTSEDSVRATLKEIAPDVELIAGKVAQGSTDLIGLVSQLGDMDLYMINLGGPGCIQAEQALESVAPDKPIVAGAACVNDAVISQVGKEAVEGIYFASNSEIVTASSGLTKDAELFNEKYAKYGDAKYATDPFAAQEFGLMVTLRNVLAGLSEADLTNEKAISTAITSFKGPVVLGSPKVSCPGALQKQVCASAVRAYEVKDGKAVPLASPNNVIDTVEVK